MDNYQDLTIAISECNLPLHGKWSANLVANDSLDPLDVDVLSWLTGYGDTPLEAAANLLAMAVSERKRREP